MEEACLKDFEELLSKAGIDHERKHSAGGQVLRAFPGERNQKGTYGPFVDYLFDDKDRFVGWFVIPHKESEENSMA